MGRRAALRSPSRLHDWRIELPALELGTPLAVLDGGSHSPLLCELEEPATGRTERWVVKTPSMYRGMTTPLLRELVAADAFSAVGLPTPQAGLLRIPATPPPTDETDAGKYAAKIYAADAGRLAFCSSFVDAPPALRRVFVHRGRMNERTIRDAVVLNAFDRFVWHGDRRTANPNCLVSSGHIIPIDHDRIFYALDRVDQAGVGPDLSSDLPPDSVLEHVARDLVVKHLTHPAWDDLALAIVELLPRLTHLRSRWPDEWDRGFGGVTRAGAVDLICEFLQTRGADVVAIMKGFRS